jgi:nitroimidazol reductase NimA-like FMN-containing flavoprotein (pyridoxamine 5'-phosphate oxidase superfamily)
MSDLLSRVIRREARAIAEQHMLAALLHAAVVGRVGVIAGGEPYIVPMNFAYDDDEGATPGRIIVHGASQGRLLRAIETHPRVCFEIDTYLSTIPHAVLCEFDTAYASVICWGDAQLLISLEERTTALRLLARKYAPVEKANALKKRTVERFRSDMGSQTAVVAITIETMTGKQQSDIVR